MRSVTLAPPPFSDRPDEPAKPPRLAKPKCGSQTKQGAPGDLCKRPAGWGTKHPGTGHCKLHGGSTPNQEKAAVTEQAAATARLFGTPIKTTPEEALLDLVRETAGIVAWVGEIVRGLDREVLLWGRTERMSTDGEDGGYTKFKAERNAWLQLWQDERDRLARYSAATLKAGVEERRARLAEQQGMMIVQVLRGVLDELELSAEQRAKVPHVVPRLLRSVGQVA